MKIAEFLVGCIDEGGYIRQSIEDIIDESEIPHVVECNSFTRGEWEIMRSYANNLSLPKVAA